VESLLIKNYEEHVNAVLSHVEAPLAEANKEVVLKKVTMKVSTLLFRIRMDFLIWEEADMEAILQNK